MDRKKTNGAVIDPGVKLSVTGRHMEIAPSLRKYVLEKTERLTRYFKNIQKIEVIVNPEKEGRFSAEMVAHAPRGSVLVCHSADQTATAAFDTAIEKMERHLRRLKDRLQKRSARGGGARRLPQGRDDEKAEGEDSGEIWW